MLDVIPAWWTEPCLQDHPDPLTECSCHVTTDWQELLNWRQIIEPLIQQHSSSPFMKLFERSTSLIFNGTHLFKPCQGGGMLLLPPVIENRQLVQGEEGNRSQHAWYSAGLVR